MPVPTFRVSVLELPLSPARHKSLGPFFHQHNFFLSTGHGVLFSLGQISHRGPQVSCLEVARQTTQCLSWGLESLGKKFPSFCSSSPQSRVSLELAGFLMRCISYNDFIPSLLLYNTLRKILQIHLSSQTIEMTGICVKQAASHCQLLSRC